MTGVDAPEALNYSAPNRRFASVRAHCATLNLSSQVWGVTVRLRNDIGSCGAPKVAGRA